MRIHLYGAGTTNARQFRDAGAELVIGDEPDQVSEQRATEYVDEGRAVLVDETAGDGADGDAE